MKYTTTPLKNGYSPPRLVANGSQQRVRDKLLQLITIPLFIFSLLYCTVSHATIDTTPIKVAVMTNKPPFSFSTGKNTYDGISIKMWQAIADHLGLNYRLIPTDMNYNEAVHAVHRKQFDVLVGPVSVTHERMKIVDYSRPYFLNKIGISVKKEKNSFARSFLAIFGETLVLMLISLAAGILIFSHFFWIAERKRSPHISSRYSRGIIDSVWFMMVCFLRDVTHEPATHTARFVLFVWLMLSVTFMTTIVAFVTSSLTYSISQQHSVFERYADLTNKKLTAEQGSINIQIIRRLGASAIPAKSLSSALELVQTGEVLGLVGDFYLMKDIIEKEQLTDSFQLLELILSHDEYAFVFPENSKLVKPVNLILTKLQDNGTASSVCQQFLGPQYAHSCEF